MAKLIEKIKELPIPVITVADLKRLFANQTSHSRYGAVKRALQSSQLIQICRGLYAIPSAQQKGSLNTLEIANYIYQPSYISFETALSYHGLIPEAVFEVTSASLKRACQFETPFGTFSYSSIPCSPFYLGVHRVLLTEQRGCFIASPERALCDFVYKKKLQWQGIELLCDCYRIELDDLLNLSQEKILAIANAFRSNNVKHFIKNLVEELGNVNRTR